MLNILIADGMEKSSLEVLEKMNFNVVDHHYDKNDLMVEIKKYNIIVVRSATKITKDIIDEAVKDSNLKLIIRAGVGLDNIDVDYAKENGIIVRNTPNASSSSVAELVLAHIFNMARFLHNSNISMRKGEWNKKNYQGVEIEGKVLGIIGFGRIGKVLAEKASALGMQIKFYDPLGPGITSEDFRYCDLEELFKTSDFISLHIPHKRCDKAIIAKDEIEKMKDGVYLINCARGGVIDEEALLDALDAGTIAGAAIDVFMDEPCTNRRLCTHDKVSVTPHIGGSTKEAQRKIGEEINDIILEFYKGSKANDYIETI
ncbi:MAG: 3-phosphoglycerate dehydrogenase [Clostridium sp.]|nr:3-phosphoglycerate dehydrogenase [Clostridium sp.]